MRLHFHTEQQLPYSLDTVFAFFANPANLPRLMPDWQRARIESAIFVPPPPPAKPFPCWADITAGSGTRLTLTVRPVPLSPIRIRWDALIEDFRWLEGFCDLQLRGPFRYWRHCHTVQPHGEGTMLHDAVEYELPLGPLSPFADALVVRHQLAAAFRFRHRRTLELLAKKSSQQSL